MNMLEIKMVLLIVFSKNEAQVLAIGLDLHTEGSRSMIHMNNAENMV